MDEAFLLRARRLLDERRTPLDHLTLLENISAQAANSPTARASIAVNQVAAVGDPAERVAALILAGEGWQMAVRQQGGCFNRAVPVRRVNTV